MISFFLPLLHMIIFYLFYTWFFYRFLHNYFFNLFYTINFLPFCTIFFTLFYTFIFTSDFFLHDSFIFFLIFNFSFSFSHIITWCLLRFMLKCTLMFFCFFIYIWSQINPIHHVIFQLVYLWKVVLTVLITNTASMFGYHEKPTIHQWDPLCNYTLIYSGFQGSRKRGFLSTAGRISELFPPARKTRCELITVQIRRTH